MKPSKVLLISVFITATILVIVGVVTTTLLVNDKASETQAKYEELLQQASQTQADYDQLVEQANQREAQYQQLIQDANQKLETANHNLLAMQNQIKQVQQQRSAQPPVQEPTALASSAKTDTTTSASSSPAMTITPEVAGQLAQKVADAGQTLLKQPELVDFQGKTAYEALFAKGSIYVDAQDGSILFNTTIPQQITADQATQLVIDYMNYKDVLQTDLIHVGTQALYRIILKNGYIAYVDMTGQITHINPPGTSNANLQVVSDSSSSGSSKSSGHKSSSHSGDDGGGGDD
jgi:uncharacterized membrane protein YgcG